MIAVAGLEFDNFGGWIFVSRYLCKLGVEQGSGHLRRAIVGTGCLFALCRGIDSIVVPR